MRPGVRADGVAGRGDLPEDFRIIGRVLADREERRLDALVGQRLEHAPAWSATGRRRRSARPPCRAGSRCCLKCSKPKPGTAGGVDLDRARDAERVGIVAFGRGCRTVGPGGGKRGSLGRGLDGAAGWAQACGAGRGGVGAPGRAAVACGAGAGAELGRWDAAGAGIEAGACGGRGGATGGAGRSRWRRVPVQGAGVARRPERGREPGRV